MLGLAVSVRVRGYRVGIRIRVGFRVRYAQGTIRLQYAKVRVRNVWKPFIPTIMGTLNTANHNTRKVFWNDSMTDCRPTLNSYRASVFG